MNKDSKDLFCLTGIPRPSEGFKSEEEQSTRTSPLLTLTMEMRRYYNNLSKSYPDPVTEMEGVNKKERGVPP